MQLATCIADRFVNNCALSCSFSLYYLQACVDENLQTKIYITLHGMELYQYNMKINSVKCNPIDPLHQGTHWQDVTGN